VFEITILLSACSTVTIPRVNILAIIYTLFVLIENVQLFAPKGPDILSISHEVLR